MAEIQKLLNPEPYLKYPSDENPTTEQQYQDFVKNVHNTLESTMNAVKLWQPETSYAADEIISSPNMKPNTVAKVTTAGKSNNIEPTWTAVGTTVEDNGCKYLIVRKCQESATVNEAKAGKDTMKLITPAVLKEVLATFKLTIFDEIYPIGSLYETTTNNNPNTLWPGTKWEKMDGGRVLVSAGAYTESGTTYTYNLGDTGGEAKHQLTTGELANHDHDIAISTANLDGYLSTENTYVNGGPGHRDGGGIVKLEGTYNAYRADGGSDKSNHMGRNLHIAASHGHSATISTAGNNQAHENRMPYTVINRWKRTA